MLIEKDSIVNVDAIEGLKKLEAESIDLVVTSPPYAHKKKYDVEKYRIDSSTEIYFNTLNSKNYLLWFMPIAFQIKRVLKKNGSFILNINDNVVDGFRSMYVFKIITELNDNDFFLWERFFWIKRNPMPGMGGVRFRDATEYLLWFAKDKPQLFMDAVKTDAIWPKEKREKSSWGISRSGHSMKKRNSSARFPDKVVPRNVIETNLGSNYPIAGKHPAIFPEEIPEFFIKACTKESDIVLDPFAGSGTTLAVAKRLGRRYLGFDVSKKYCEIAEKRIMAVGGNTCGTDTTNN